MIGLPGHRLPRVLATCAALVLSACGGSQAPAGPGIPSIAGATSQNPCEIDVDFGDVPFAQTSTVTLDIQNLDGGVLDLSAQTGGLDPEFAVDGSGLLPIAPGGSDSMRISFQPFKLAQVQSSFSIQTSGFNPACPASAGSPSALTVQVTGTGIGVSMLAKPNVMDFGDTLVGTTETRSVILDNESPATVEGIIAFLAGPGADLFTLSGVPSVLEGYQSAEVTITYTPTAPESRSLASVTFESDDGVRATLDLFGEPIACALTVAPDPPDFGYVAAGTTGMACTTLTNVCSLPLTVSAVNLSNPAGPISLSTQIPVAIPGGSNATICFSYTAATSGWPPTETVTFVLEGWNAPNPAFTL